MTSPTPDPDPDVHFNVGDCVQCGARAHVGHSPDCELVQRQMERCGGCGVFKHLTPSIHCAKPEEHEK